MIVLRSKQTQLYYATVGGWSPDPKKALTFPDVLRARAFIETVALGQVEIVLRTEHGESIIPLSDFPDRSGS